MTTEAIVRRAPADPGLRYQMWALERMLTVEERRRQRPEDVAVLDTRCPQFGEDRTLL
jgi:hypothetical protein